MMGQMLLVIRLVVVAVVGVEFLLGRLVIGFLTIGKFDGLIHIL